MKAEDKLFWSMIVFRSTLFVAGTILCCKLVFGLSIIAMLVGACIGVASLIVPYLFTHD